MINKIVLDLSKLTTKSKYLKQDILILEFTIVNAFIIDNSNSHSKKWVLVDAGLENSYNFIIKTAEKRFGKACRPEAIILTHGHFDHIGSVIELSEKWEVPVFAHELEVPYITGKKDYPKADPTVDEGLVAKMSPSFPHLGINLGHRAASLPSDHSIPGIPDWEWIHTPGHTEGHISLFRRRDGVLIAGDAFTTTKQESLSSIITQKEKIKGPPAYLTTDWRSAEKSINRLKNLSPVYVLPSHGKPMEGKKLHRHLNYLTKHFNEIALPKQGKFLDQSRKS